jgi:putative salt-induced outer membrane protein
MSLNQRALQLFALAACAALPTIASAAGWTGTGELGLAVTTGNAQSENLNGKLGFINEDDQWKHSAALSLLRAKGEVVGDFDGDGSVESSRQLTASRYDFAASSAYKYSQRTSWVTSLRYENDDFAPSESQLTFAIGHGYQWIDSETTKLRTEIGPGYRRAKDAGTGESQSDFIVRGGLDFSHVLTSNTDLYNNLLLESGSDNTFVQNELGVAVAMNATLALKAGLQARHNTEVGPGIKQTDTLTTLNLVYTFD